MRGSRIPSSSNVSIPTLAEHDRRRGAERHAELGLERGRRTVVDKDGRRRWLDVDVDSVDIVCGEPLARAQIEQRVQRRVRAGTRRIQLHGDAGVENLPPRAEIRRLAREVGRARCPSRAEIPAGHRAPARSPSCPRCASIAASTPLRAASPACSGFTIVPKFSLRPDASDAAIASACAAAPRRVRAAGSRPRPRRSCRASTCSASRADSVAGSSHVRAALRFRSRRRRRRAPRGRTRRALPPAAMTAGTSGALGCASDTKHMSS